MEKDKVHNEQYAVERNGGQVGWSCKRCTLINEDCVVRCAACHTRRRRQYPGHVVSTTTTTTTTPKTSKMNQLDINAADETERKISSFHKFESFKNIPLVQFTSLLHIDNNDDDDDDSQLRYDHYNITNEKEGMNDPSLSSSSSSSVDPNETIFSKAATILVQNIINSLPSSSISNCTIAFPTHKQQQQQQQLVIMILWKKIKYTMSNMQ
mmetsp:Transcript_7437/g.9909  ORF Transcript_7437/g.9909 Transcript_7437/m.9909 type:complete len:210 (-) Transcript_7437:408-1037(-)